MFYDPIHHPDMPEWWAKVMSEIPDSVTDTFLVTSIKYDGVELMTTKQHPARPPEPSETEIEHHSAVNTPAAVTSQVEELRAKAKPTKQTPYYVVIGVYINANALAGAVSLGGGFFDKKQAEMAARQLCTPEMKCQVREVQLDVPAGMPMNVPPPRTPRPLQGMPT